MESLITASKNGARTTCFSHKRAYHLLMDATGFVGGLQSVRSIELSRFADE
jgi:hypothetical protein